VSPPDSVPARVPLFEIGPAGFEFRSVRELTHDRVFVLLGKALTKSREEKAPATAGTC